MKILEVKNNLVKISYTAQDKLVLSGFVIIEDSLLPYVAQIMSLKADSGVNYAIAKLLFTFNSEGVVKNYNGTVPEMNAVITPLSSDELLDILPIETPLTIGKLAQQKFILNVDYSILEKNLLICSDNNENTDLLLSNFAKQTTANNNKSIIFDTTGTIQAENKLVFSKDFKLPLNYDTINYIYEHDLADIEPASKAIIQDILLEVQEYSKTVLDRFIPFDAFISAIDSQYKALKMPELAILKNRLLKYKETEIFAQEAKDIHSLRGTIRANLSTLLDISTVDAELQKLIISTVYDEIYSLDLFVYSFVKIDNQNSDKKLLKKFITDSKIYTTVTCSHEYKYLHELKERAVDMIFTSPISLQHDFGSYNVFLNKLNSDECVIVGKATQNIPLIIELLPYEELESTLFDINNEEISHEENIEVQPEEELTTEYDTFEMETLEDIPAEEQEQEQEQDEDEEQDVEENIEESDAEMIPVEEFNSAQQEQDIIQEEHGDDVVLEDIVSDEEDNYEDDESNDTSEFIDIPTDVTVPEIESEEEVDVELAEINEINEINEPETEPEIEVEDNGMADSTEDDYYEEPVYMPDYEEDSVVLPEEDFSDAAEPLSEYGQNPLIDEPQDNLTEDDLNFIDDINTYNEEQSFNEEPVNEEDYVSDIDEFSGNEANEDNEVTYIEPDNEEKIDTSEEIYYNEEDDIEETSDEDTTPVVPIYPVEETPVNGVQEIYEQGDRVTHPKYGEGVVEKMVKFGNKVLCAINFANGRRLLDPTISQIQKL